MYINTEGLDNRVTNLGTEQRNPNTVEIANVSTAEMLRMINREDATVAEKVADAIDKIAEAVELIAHRMSMGGRLVYVGAGTSARLAFMDAAECPPTYYVHPEDVTCIMAGGRDCVFRANEMLEDSEDDAVRDLKKYGLAPMDTVVACAASGRTPYCIGALKYAASIGAGHVSMACNLNSEMGKFAEVAIEMDTGAEAIMGSTRMKAGTAQKMAMNMLSTGVMIRLGRTYGNVLLRLPARNSKLSNRDLRYFAEAVGTNDLAYAKDCLKKAHGSSLCAAIMENLNVDYETALQAATIAQGRVHLAFRLAKQIFEEKHEKYIK